VLSGVIAATLAQGLDAFAAAAAGVWLHAEAGRQAARRVGAPEGVIATDVISALPEARATSHGRIGPRARDAGDHGEEEQGR
jgi:NAD(P)H-hydrate epimerase